MFGCRICVKKLHSAGVMDKCKTPAWFVMSIWSGNREVEVLTNCYIGGMLWRSSRPLLTFILVSQLSQATKFCV